MVRPTVENQPENIKIAGKATVGIRGTEIMAKHGEESTTFVLLSGSMEIATESGRQLINRSGYGIDISNDGMLGIVRHATGGNKRHPCATNEKGRKQIREEASSDEKEEPAEAEEEVKIPLESEAETDGEAEASPMHRLKANRKPRNSLI